MGCANVAAAGGTDVLMAEDFYEKIAEGDRTQKIGKRNGEEPGVHGLEDEFSKTARARPRWLTELKQITADEFEGGLAGPEANSFAVAREIEFFDLRILYVGEGDVDKADGFVYIWAGGTGAGAGDASDGDAERCAGAGP